MSNTPTASLPNTALAAALEKSINMALRYDPGTRQKLASLDGKCLHIHVSAPELHFALSILDEEINVLASDHESADCAIRGDLVSLISLLGKDTSTLANSGVEVMGDSNLLAKLTEIAKALDIDWEEPINDLFGDVIGHSMANKLRDSSEWLSKRAAILPGYLGELISEELKLIPTKTELDNFSHDVSQLRSDTERLFARIEKLANNINQQPENSQS